MKLNLTKLSRTISHALRHNPGQYGLKLDEAGWTPVKNLLEALRRRRSEWKRLCEDDIIAMMNFSDKQRFELRDGKIRALYGHSIRNKPVKIAIKPPDILFHGTSPKVVDTIQKVGLKPMGRQFDCEKHERSNKPVVLRILAVRAYQNGVQFYQGNEKVWLADYVPPEFIEET